MVEAVQRAVQAQAIEAQGLLGLAQRLAGTHPGETGLQTGAGIAGPGLPLARQPLAVRMTQKQLGG